jgi:hypothetical protein
LEKHTQECEVIKAERGGWKVVDLRGWLALMLWYVTLFWKRSRGAGHDIFRYSF